MARSAIFVFAIAALLALSSCQTSRHAQETEQKAAVPSGGPAPETETAATAPPVPAAQPTPSATAPAKPAPTPPSATSTVPPATAAASPAKPSSPTAGAAPKQAASAARHISAEGTARAGSSQIFTARSEFSRTASEGHPRDRRLYQVVAEESGRRLVERVPCLSQGSREDASIRSAAEIRLVDHEGAVAAAERRSAARIRDCLFARGALGNFDGSSKICEHLTLKELP